jgi:6-phosphogluconolactonase
MLGAKIVRGEAPEEVARNAADAIARELERVLATAGSATIALAGGATPRAIYSALASRSLPWERVRFYFGDERCVPPTSVDSNHRLADEALFMPASVPAASVFRMHGEAPDRLAEAARYSALLPPALDLLLLGMGEDGHTASLFPGASSLSTTELVVPVVGPKPPPERLTITPVVLDAAKKTFVFVTGAGKAEVLARALRAPSPQASTGLPPLPIQLARRVTLFADRAALALTASEGSS